MELITSIIVDMARPLNSEPTYICGKCGRARIYWRGQQMDLPGPKDSSESLQAFHQTAAIIAATGSFPVQKLGESKISVREMSQLYLAWAKNYYSGSREPTNLSYAMKELNLLWADMDAESFRPAHLKAVRTAIINKGQVRRTANKRTQQIIACFGWAVVEGLIDSTVWYALKALKPVPKGRENAVDKPSKRPVSDECFHLTLEHASFEVASALRVLALTGMRTGELLQMRPQDVDMTGAHWIYRPQSHKTQAKTGDTLIAIPAVATAILIAHMPKSFSEPWFPCCSSWLRNAVKRICLAHDIPLWHPHQLRHRFVTKVSNAINDKAAQTLARHHDPKMTDHYTARDIEPLLLLMDQLPDLE